LAFETLNQIAGECSSVRLWESKSLGQQLLHIHARTVAWAASCHIVDGGGEGSMDFDPRDDDSRDDDRVASRDVYGDRHRDDDARSVGRGRGHSREAGDDDRGNDPRGPDRERVMSRGGFDPREPFTRDLDLPRGPDRELVRDRDRAYTLHGSETRTLATVGAFRVVSSRDLRDCHARSGRM
jgi:hypothetical protein